MWPELGTAFALFLVIEGFFPFLNPGAMRRRLLQISQLDDRTMRLAGLMSMSVGVGLLYLLK